jgi:hypothetical protein
MTLEQLRALKNEMNRLFNLTMGMSGPGQLDLDKLAKGEQKTLDCVTAMLAEKNTEIAALKARIADLEGFEPLPILNRDEDSIATLTQSTSPTQGRRMLWGSASPKSSSLHTRNKHAVGNRDYQWV